jgi:type IV pilus assembly protein PilA
MRTNQTGFSLIELLIVVSVILVIAAIAIPNLLRSRMAANETSAVASLRAINTSQIVYPVMAPPSPQRLLISAMAASPPTARLSAFLQRPLPA